MITIEKSDLYPLMFEPAYKEIFWGGSKFKTVLGRNLPDDLKTIGEAWEICDRPNVSSAVLNGELAGVTLGELTVHFGRDFVGKNYNGGAFPIMLKLIDVTKRLSLQVHPTEEYCNGQTTLNEPKAEMWYILQADKGSKIYTGLKSSATRQKFLSMIQENDIIDLLQCFEAVPGDAYFIPSGRIHCIGAGSLTLEISQNSDTTFRISDWNRIMENGERRELHVHDAIASMDFINRTSMRICGACSTGGRNCKFSLINKCPYFRCEELMLSNNWRDNTAVGESCHILTAVNKPFSVTGKHGKTDVPAFASVLIPACYGEYVIEVDKNSQTNIIRTTL